MEDNYGAIAFETLDISEEVKIYIKSPLSSQNILGLSAPDEQHWLNWRFGMRKGKWTKVPYMPSGWMADSTNPSTWSTFNQVVAVQDRFNGVGIVFTGTSMGIDIDHCLKSGIIVHELKEQILKLIAMAGSYVEISPSGEGIHLVIGLTTPIKLVANKHMPFEVYTKGRYFTVTQNFYGETKPVRTVTPEEALSLLSIIGYPWDKKESKQESAMAPVVLHLDDATVLSKMFASTKVGAKIQALYNGDLTDYNNDHSSADMALCSYLAFWTGCNAEQMDRLWLNSPLGAREKTQIRKENYRDVTIRKAIDGCRKVYNGEPSGGIAAFLTPDGKVIPYNIAQYLIEKYHVKTIGERVREPYIYQCGIYIFGLHVLKAEIQEILKGLATPHQKTNIIEMIKDSTLTDRNDFNMDKNLINLENGIFDIKNQVLIPHSHEYLFFTKIPVKYDASATCPTIKKFLGEILPEEHVKIIIEWFGYCLYRSYFLKKAIIFVGEKDTGKTTLLKLFAWFLGKDNASGVSLQKIVADKFASSHLYNKHINIYDELAFRDINDNGQFKMVTGDGIISGEKKFGDQFQFRNFSKLTFACNKIPDVKDGNDDAYFNRWIIIPFMAEIKSVDKFLTEKITTEEELSGLLNLSLAALCEIIQKQDFSYGKNWEEIKKEMLLSGSMVANFVIDCLTEEADAWVSKDDMYKECAKYARANNLPIINKEFLGRKLPNHSGFILDGTKMVDGKQVQGWRNVKIKEKQEKDG